MRMYRRSPIRPVGAEWTALAAGLRAEDQRHRRERNCDVMRLRHGEGPDKATCGQCAHLYRRAVGTTTDYYRCRWFGASKGASSDFRRRWPACGKFTSLGG